MLVAQPIVVRLSLNSTSVHRCDGKTAVKVNWDRQLSQQSRDFRRRSCGEATTSSLELPFIVLFCSLRPAAFPGNVEHVRPLGMAAALLFHVRAQRIDLHLLAACVFHHALDECEVHAEASQLR